MKKRPFLFLAVVLIVLCAAYCAVSADALRSISAFSSDIKEGKGFDSGLETQLKELKNESVMSVGGVSPQPQVSAAGFARVAYLTFDDGPSKLTPQLLGTLESNGVRATFFIIGLNAEKYPEALTQMVDDGDVIGVHSWTHKYSYIYKSVSDFMCDFDTLRDYIRQTTGVEPEVCRFPGGTNNTVSDLYSEHIMSKIVPIVTGMGIKPYDWNVDSGDAVTHVPTKDQIVQTVLSQSSRHSVAVILFHDADQHASTIAALPEIITGLREMGYTFGTLSQEGPTVEFKAS